MTVTEVILSSSADDDHMLLWDLRTLAVLGSYKGNPKCARHGVAQLGPRLLIGTQADKASLRVWAWEKDQPLHRFSGPEKIPTIASTPDGTLCFGGSATGKLLVWEVGTGRLVRVIDAHFKAVTVLKVVDDGSLLISGGGDGAVHVWDVAGLVQGHPGASVAPVLTFSEHMLTITDIHVGVGGRAARIVTSSLDRSCKIWELASGTLLCSLVFPAAVTSVVVDPAEFTLVAGASTGALYNVSLYESAFVRASAVPADRERHVHAQSALQHSDGRPVTCLALSYDATLLIAGMADGTVAIWDIASRQMLKTFRQHKGEITNVLCCAKPPTVLTQPYSAASIPAVSPFARYLPEDISAAAAETKVFAAQGDSQASQDAGAGGRQLLELSVRAHQAESGRREAVAEKESLEANYRKLLAENERIRGLNSELYRRAVEAQLGHIQEQ